MLMLPIWWVGFWYFQSLAVFYIGHLTAGWIPLPNRSGPASLRFRCWSTVPVALAGLWAGTGLPVTVLHPIARGSIVMLVVAALWWALASLRGEWFERLPWLAPVVGAWTGVLACIFIPARDGTSSVLAVAVSVLLAAGYGYASRRLTMLRSQTLTRITIISLCLAYASGIAGCGAFITGSVARRYSDALEVEVHRSLTPGLTTEQVFEYLDSRRYKSGYDVRRYSIYAQRSISPFSRDPHGALLIQQWFELRLQFDEQDVLQTVRGDFARRLPYL